MQVSKLHFFSFLAQICSGITRGTVLKGELYRHWIQKFIYLHLFAELFGGDFLAFVMRGDGGGRVAEVRAGTTSPTPEHNEWKEICMKLFCKQMQIN